LQHVLETSWIDEDCWCWL